MTTTLNLNGNVSNEGSSGTPPPLMPIPTQRVSVSFSESTGWLLNQPTSRGFIETFRVLPASLADQANRLHRWRIVLHCVNGDLPLIGLDLIGDVIVGRANDSGPVPDLDLGEMNATATQSISHRHALLRPTERKLYIIDLDSTNGTMRNALPIASSSAQALNHGDTLSFGDVAFVIRILERPGERPLADTAKHPPNPETVEEQNGALIGLVKRLKHFVE